MTAVFVHGVPETSAIWGPLVERLDRDDVVLLSPPGFGVGVPSGWGATYQEYAAWLIAELERFDAPVDLVGHDWGGLHVLNVAMQRPDLLRTWASDVLGVVDPEYVWHDMAQVWQSPDGDAAIAAMYPADPSLVEAFAGMGLGTDIATEVVAAQDETMGRSILALYRSAAQPAMAELGAGIGSAAVTPGLAIVPSGDPFTGGAAMAERSAGRAGASIVSLDGCGHWWMIEDAAAGATALGNFWSAAAAR